MKILPVLLFVIWTELQVVQTANILVYGMMGSHSTRISKLPYMEALADKGHNVTYLSPFAKESENGNSTVKAFIPKKWLEVLGSWDKQMAFFEVRQKKILPYMWYALRNMGVLSCEALYSDPEFIEWVNSVPKFDLVVVEASANECAYGLVWLWKAKLAIYSTTTTVPWMYDQYGLPDETSSVSDTILNYPSWKPMSFMDRFINALCPVLFTLTWENEYLPRLEQVTRNGLGLEENDLLPRFMDIGRSASLILLTSHFSLDFPRSLPPHVKEIGGIAMTNEDKPIPKDISAFINSTTGFIYISFGTVADFTTFDAHVQQEFINGLKNFPNINFLWVSPKEIHQKLPANIFISKWAPQKSILAHPKLKMFITHAGMGSTIEAVYNSVPLICLPVLAEQDFNANSLTARGAGITLEITSLKESQLKNAITEVLKNPKYRKAMNKLSTIYKDRITPPLEEAVWWTEYVLRHETVNSFIVPQSASQQWWKRRQIDVWLVAALLIAVTASVFVLIFAFVTRKLAVFLKTRIDMTVNQKKNQ